jgi:hypothetical protein
VQQFPPQMPMVVHCDQIQLQPRAPVLPKPPSPGADLAATAAAVDTTAVDEPAAAGAPAAADKPDDSGPLPQGALNGTEKMIVIAAVKNFLAVGETALKLSARSATNGFSREGVFLAVWRSIVKKEELERKESLMLLACEGLAQLKSCATAVRTLDRFYVEEMVPHCSGDAGQRITRGLASCLRQHLIDHPKSYMAEEASEGLLMTVLEHTASHYVAKV